MHTKKASGETDEWEERKQRAAVTSSVDSPLSGIGFPQVLCCLVRGYLCWDVSFLPAPQFQMFIRLPFGAPTIHNTRSDAKKDGRPGAADIDDHDQTDGRAAHGLDPRGNAHAGAAAAEAEAAAARRAAAAAAAAPQVDEAAELAAAQEAIERQNIEDMVTAGALSRADADAMLAAIAGEAPAEEDPEFEEDFADE